MKKLIAKQSGRTFENKVLKEVVEKAKKLGFNVYTFKSSSTKIAQIFIENKQGNIGSCSAYYSGIQFSTMHISERGSGNGSGFGGLIKGQDFNSPEDLNICFITYPHWAGITGEVKKYSSFLEYINKGTNTILNYYKL